MGKLKFVLSSNIKHFRYFHVSEDQYVGLFGFTSYCRQKVAAEERRKIETASKKSKILLCTSKRVSSQLKCCF